MTNRLPLEGIRVTNFGWVWAGPVFGQTLARMGAEVIKVESYARVDLTRRAPPFAQNKMHPDYCFAAHNLYSSMLSVSVDLTKPQGRELILKLVAKSDVVCENWSPKAKHNLGLDYDTLKAVKPDLIMVSIPAAGQWGPWRNVITYGTSLAAITGIDSLTGYYGGSPQVTEQAYTDPWNGVLSAFAVLCALNYRKRTGKGQYIDYSQQEAVSSFHADALMDYVMNGRVQQPLGNRHFASAMAPHGVYRCRGDDKWVSIAAANDEEWRAICQVMGRTELAQDPRFADTFSRVQHQEELDHLVEEWTSQRDNYEVMHLLQQAGVAAAPTMRTDELAHDPHYRERQTWVEVEHPAAGKETIYGNWLKFNKTPLRITPGPTLGQHNDYVFLELLGLSREEYERLKEEKAIY